MNRKYLILIAAVFGLLLSACKDTKKPERALVPGVDVAMEVSPYDTTAVLNLTNEYLELLKAGDIDGAMARLYWLGEDDQVHPLPAEEQEKCRFWLQAYKVYAYRITSFTFYKETDSKVEYEMTIQDPATTEEPGKMKGLIRPVRRDGQWYITLANTETEVHKSELDN